MGYFNAPQPAIPIALKDVLRVKESFDGMMEAGMGVSYLANRTAYGILQQQAQSLPAMQRYLNGVHNSILDMAKIHLDKYLPVELKQFRFPRSKKKRIRRKWAKDTKNWREVPILFKIRFNSNIELPPIKPLAWQE